MKIINGITGEGTQSSSALMQLPRKPESIKHHVLENLYNWTIASRAIQIVPITVLGAEITVHPAAEALLASMTNSVADTWVSGRLYGSAWLDKDHIVRIGEPNADETCVCKFIGRKNIGRQRQKRHISVLIPAYDDILRYGMAATVGNHLLQKMSFISYPVPNLYQNAQDPKYLCGLKDMVQEMQSLGVLAYDSSGQSPRFNEIDLDKVVTYIDAMAQMVSSSLAIPHSLLFSKSPGGSTSGRFEIAQWLSSLRYEANQLKAAWVQIAEHYGHPPQISINLDSIIDLYTSDSVDRTVS